jgi:hypothetical protein
MTKIGLASSRVHPEMQEALEKLASERAPATEIQRPTFGGPQRDAINSVVDGLVSEICADIGKLRITLDEVEQQVLEGAAHAKQRLNDQVQICVSVKDEITHMNRVVADIQERGKTLLV